MNKSFLYILLLGVLVIISSCTPRVKVDYSMSEGNIDFLYDESFANIIEQHVYVFTHSNPGAFIDGERADDHRLLDAILTDSVRLVAMTRPLTEAEKNKILVENSLNCNETHIAVDAVAFVVNKSNPDSVLTVDDLRRIFTGEVTEWKQIFPDSKLGSIQIVFDNSRSSTVRYIADSLCAPQPLYAGLTAADSTMQMIQEVSKRPNALGVMGASWVVAKDDKNNKVRSLVTPVRVKKTPESEAYGPYQAFIASGKYPFFRSIYMINTESVNGLCTGFTIFVAGQRGQKIFEKSNISPARIEERVVNLKDEF